MEKVVYYSCTKKTGFYIIDYKNGNRSIVALDNRIKKHLYIVASSEFNPVTRRVIVKVMDKSDKFTLDYRKEEWGVLDFINLDNELLHIKNPVQN